MDLSKRFFLVAILLLPSISMADAVLDWNEVALARVVGARQSPPDSARTMAMVHVAIFEAVNAVEPRYAPFTFKGRAPAGTSSEAAAATAAYSVLLKLLPDQAAPVEAAYTASMARIPEGNGKSSGIALGPEAASQCLSMRENDGTGAPGVYRPRTVPGAYVMTVLPVSTEWPAVRPWFLSRGAQFRPGPPPSLASAEWARDYNEVKNLGARQSAARSAEQTEVARFCTITGAASWNPVVRSLALSKPLGPVDNARLFALVNMAASDAFVAVFDAKYAHTSGVRLQRSETVTSTATTRQVSTPSGCRLSILRCIRNTLARTASPQERSARCWRRNSAREKSRRSR